MPATQTIEFRAVTGQTVTAKLFAAGSDTEVASVSATEQTHRKGTYRAAFTDVAAGEYQLLAFNATPIPLASWWVTLTLTTDTFQVYDRVDKDGITRSNWAALTVDHTSTGSMGAVVAAIKASTDNLPSDPADASDIAAVFVTVNSKLDAIDDYVDSEVAAIKAVTDKLDGMLVLDGLVYQYTANALELGGSSSTVYVYPMSMEQEPRNTHATITVYTEETGSQYFFAYDSAGIALSLTGKTLEFRVADTKSQQRLYTAKTSDGTLTISLGNKVTFTKSTKFTRFANTDVTYSLRDMDAGGEVLLDGQIELMWAP